MAVSPLLLAELIVIFIGLGIVALGLFIVALRAQRVRELLQQSAELRAQYEKVFKELVDVREQYIDTFDELMALRFHQHAQRLAIDELITGVQVLLSQLNKAGIKAEWQPNGIVEKLREADDQEVLYTNLVEYFSIDEMREVAFLLGIGAEALPGDTRRAFARHLIDYSKRHGLLNQLTVLAAQLRPQATWPIGQWRER